VIVPVDPLPGPVAAVAGALPAAPLSELLRDALGSGSPAADIATPIVLLAVWAIATLGLSSRTFRWE
jgi:ABC-2 type transport system permease protein